jgi:hypothetical protein
MFKLNISGKNEKEGDFLYLLPSIVIVVSPEIKGLIMGWLFFELIVGVRA